MSAEIKAVPDAEEVDPDALAKAEALVNQARLDWQKKSNEAMNKAVEETGGKLAVFVQVGNELWPLSQLLKLQAHVVIVAK